MDVHRLFVGSAAEILATLEPASVQLIVTSPPYWCLKDYEHPRQIGHQDTYEGYLSRLVEVWAGCKRVLEPGCRMAVNVGDQFLRAKDHGEYGVAPIHADIIQQVQVLGGFRFLGGVIWQKITTTKTSGGGTWMGSVYHPRDGYITFEHEFILIFKKRGKARKPTKQQRDLSRLTKEQRSSWFRGIWKIPPVRQKRHQAMFPVELPERLMRMFTFHGETVLDPFLGSGSTLEAAMQSGRWGVGIELNPSFVDLCRSRVPNVKVSYASGRASSSCSLRSSSHTALPSQSAQSIS